VRVLSIDVQRGPGFTIILLNDGFFRGDEAGEGRRWHAGWILSYFRASEVRPERLTTVTQREVLRQFLCRPDREAHLWSGV